MKRLMVAGILTVGIFMMLKNTHSLFGDATRGNLALLMGGITQSELKQTIIEHYKDSILGDIGTITGDAIQTTVTDLNDDGKKDVIAILQSPQTCGTGGCICKHLCRE